MWLKLSAYTPSLAKDEDVGSSRFGTSKGRKAIYVEMDKQMFGKQMFAGPGRDSGTQSGLPHQTYSIFFADLSGDRSILEIGPSSKFIEAVRGKVSVSA